MYNEYYGFREAPFQMTPNARLFFPSSGHSRAERHLLFGLSQGEGFVVVTQVGRQRFGILVDGVFHTEEIVVKPMSSKLRHITLFSGNTILGDGAVVLIIDPNGFARMVGSESDRNEFQGRGRTEEWMAITEARPGWRAGPDPKGLPWFVRMSPGARSSAGSAP